MRLLRGSAPARSLVASAAVLVALLAAAPVALRADAVDDDVTAMKLFEQTGKADECVARIEALRAAGDARACAPLAQMVTSKNDKIACAAIRGLAATWHDAEFFRWLVGRIEDKALYQPPEGRPEVYKCVLEAIRAYPPEKVKAALKPLGEAVNRFFTTEPEYADRAIRAYGSVPDRFTVQQLLAWLGQPSTGAGVKEARENRDRANKAILETLTQLCGKDVGDAAQWKKWWDANGKTFKFPDPAKPAAPDAPPPAAAAADPSKLTEFKDESFGWSVKKPEGDAWRFFKPDYAGPRVGLLCMQAESETINVARAYFRIHDPAKYEPRTISAFADWVINTAFREQLDTEGMPQQPAAKEMRIGGVDWTVVVGKGLALGPYANWGSIERRFYLAKLDPYILYVDAFVRLSADAEDKKALWSCIESTSLPAKK